MRNECPKSSMLPNGCKNWVGESKNNPMGCKYDITEMNRGNSNSTDVFERGSYGPFYKTTDCNRLGNACCEDKYERSENYKDAIGSIDLHMLISGIVKPYECKKNWNEIYVGLLKALKEKIQNEIERVAK